MSEKTYNELADWLCNTFRTSPGLKTPEMMDLLYYRHTPEEARLALDMKAFGLYDSTIDTLTVKTGMTKDQIMLFIASMEKEAPCIYNRIAAILPTDPSAWKHWISSKRLAGKITTRHFKRN